MVTNVVCFQKMRPTFAEKRHTKRSLQKKVFTIFVGENLQTKVTQNI